MARRTLPILALSVIFLLILAVRADQTILFEKDSPFNHIIVREDEPNVRALLFEKNGAIQSLVNMADLDDMRLPYTRAMPVGLAFTEAPERVLIIGLGGGVLPGLFHRHFPTMVIDVVDIDPDVIDAARQFFGFKEDKRLKAFEADGRKFVEDSKEKYDAVFLDAYGNDSIPYHLATREFLQSVRRILTPKGVVVGNVWSRASNRLFDSMLRTYQDSFEELYIFDILASANKIFVAVPRRGKAGKEEMVKRSKDLVKKAGFNFDLGSTVTYGYNHVTDLRIEAPILKDGKEPPAK